MEAGAPRDPRCRSFPPAEVLLCDASRNLNVNTFLAYHVSLREPWVTHLSMQSSGPGGEALSDFLRAP